MDLSKLIEMIKETEQTKDIRKNLLNGIKKLLKAMEKYFKLSNKTDILSKTLY